MVKRILLCLALVAAGLLTVQAQTPLFQMNFSAGAANLAGWQALRTATPQWSLTYLTAGVDGQPAYRLAILPISSGQTGQFNVGWRGQQLPTATPGSVLWFDILFRFTDDTTFRCKDWSNNQPGSNCIDKWIMVNRDGCTGGGCRWIVTLESDRSNMTWMMRMQKDGGDQRVDTPFYARGGPYKRIIIQLRYSSSQGANDGGYSAWVDRAPTLSPTSSINAVVNVADDSEELRFGGFQNHGVESGSVYAWEVGRFTISRTMPGSGGTTSPAPLIPTSVRITE